MKIEIYGAPWCTFCEAAKSLCRNSAIDFDYIDIDDSANMRNLEERVGSKIRSVPQIFINGQLVPSGFAGLKLALGKI